MYPDRFKDKVALITGASSGIGFATAKRLACEGASVILFARRKELLEKCVQEIADNGGKACYFVGDVTNDGDVAGCIEHILETFGTIHILINNAGMELVRSFAMTSYEEWNKIIDVNLGGAIRFTQKVQKAMIKTGGVIINVSSVYGLVGVAGSSVYSMTKGGLISLTRSLALELASRNIRVNAVAAGMVETDLMDRVFRNLSSDQVERIRSMHPLGFGKPEDVSAGISFLASDDARWITGTVLVIDGGYTAI
ncbi:TPA: glucose 1-dehydrogenase [Candidatus Poribacteria bacterium]|nr:glucose 1-dehydrogenase [Candidatus Poribacteria bacterium]